MVGPGCRMPTLRCTLWNFFYVEVFVKCLDPKSFVLSRHHSPHSRVAPHKIFLLKVPPGTNRRRACACGDNSMSNASQYKHKSNVHTNHLGASSSLPPFKMRESRGHYVLAGEAPQRGHRWSQCSQPYRRTSLGVDPSRSREANLVLALPGFRFFPQGWLFKNFTIKIPK